jgi:hypothetical protein
MCVFARRQDQITVCDAAEDCDEDPLVMQLTPVCLQCLMANDGSSGPPPIEPCLTGGGSGEPIEDVDCEGDWSSCSEWCERTYVIRTELSGQGRECEVRGGDTAQCDAGEDECPEDVDCEGAWSSCPESCERTYVVSTDLSGQGQACEAVDGDTAQCDGGEGECPLPGEMCDAASGERALYTGGVAFATAERVRDLGTIGCAAGSGPRSRDVAPSVTCSEAGTFMFFGCEENVDCQGSWSDCTAECGRKEYTVSRAQAGIGYSCSAAHGAQTQCLAGEGACPPNTDCVGSWSTCDASCNDKRFTISTEQSGQGSNCDASDGATEPCPAGEGLCPQDVDCVGSWSNCGSFCYDKTYSVERAQSGQGDSCVADNGATAQCDAGEGDCPPNTDCEGSWSACTEACEKSYLVTQPQQGQGAQCQIANGATNSCTAGEGECPNAGEVCEAASGSRRMYTGGADFDTAVTVDGLGTVGCTDGFGRADPVRAPSAICTADGSFIFRGCEENIDCIGSFSTCTMHCDDKIFSHWNNTEQSGAGSSCAFHAGATSPCAPGEDDCPVNTDCVGSWSPCDADCSDKEYTVLRAQSGQGAACAVDDGATMECAAGEDSCPLDVDCIGSYSACESNCFDAVYSIQQQQSGHGSPCDSSQGDTRACSPGDGQCPVDIDCVGAWSTCTEVCEKVFSQEVAQSGAGTQCEAGDGDPMPCEPGIDACPAAAPTCHAGSGERDMYTGGAEFSDGTTVDSLGIIQCAAGFGRSDPAIAPSVLCSANGGFVFRGCEENVDCDGAWSTCAYDCGDRTFSIHAEQGGAGLRCTSSAGDTRPCAAGQGDCPSDVDCVGNWGSCNSDCLKTFGVLIARQGQGSQCEAGDSATEVCAAGEDECPQNIDCIGSFSVCARDCSGKVYEITTEQSGLGVQCHTNAGTTQTCSPGEGQCPVNTDCVGYWSSCTASCEKSYTVTTAQSGQGTQCEAEDGDPLPCEPGVDNCPAPGEVCTAASGDRDMYTGGEDFAVAESVESLGTIECAGGFGRADPDVNPSALCAVDGNFIFRGCEPTVNCFGSFPACDADCSDKEYTVTAPLAGEGYPCAYEAYASLPCAPGEDDCPVNTDCVGSWSTCDADCSAKVYTVTVPTTGQGVACAVDDGATMECAAGEDSCPLDVDCVGAWSACTADCTPKVYTVLRAQSGQGSQCDALDEATVECRAGEDYCPPNVDCVGSWGDCASTCQRTFSVSTEQSGQGSECTVSDDDSTTVTDGSQKPCPQGEGSCPSPGDDCTAGSGNSAFYTGGPDFASASTVEGLGRIGCAAGFGRADPDEAPSVLCTLGVDGGVGDFLFRGCAPNVNCEGSWTACDEECNDSMFMISIFQSGQGVACRSSDGALAPCSPGEDQCPEDIDCVGTWSTCGADCSDKLFTVRTTPFFLNFSYVCPEPVLAK